MPPPEPSSRAIYRDPFPSTRSLGCLTVLVGLSLVASSGILLLIAVGTSLGGSSGGFLLLHLGAGMALGFVGIIMGGLGAVAAIRRR